MIVVNRNMMSINSTNDLINNFNSHYRRLQTFTQQISSKPGINGALNNAEDFVVCELIRANIAVLNQTLNNANSALGIIDEGLISMKKLTQKIITNIYDSTQRLLIDSEFQAIESEISNIVNDTDFNKVKLLAQNFGRNFSQVLPFTEDDIVAASNFLSGFQVGSVLYGCQHTFEHNPDHDDKLKRLSRHFSLLSDLLNRSHYILNSTRS